MWQYGIDIGMVRPPGTLQTSLGLSSCQQALETLPGHGFTATDRLLLYHGSLDGR